MLIFGPARNPSHTRSQCPLWLRLRISPKIHICGAFVRWLNHGGNDLKLGVRSGQKRQITGCVLWKVHLPVLLLPSLSASCAPWCEQRSNATHLLSTFWSPWYRLLFSPQALASSIFCIWVCWRWMETFGTCSQIKLSSFKLDILSRQWGKLLWISNEMILLQINQYSRMDSHLY